MSVNRSDQGSRQQSRPNSGVMTNSSSLRGPQLQQQQHRHNANRINSSGNSYPSTGPTGSGHSNHNNNGNSRKGKQNARSGGGSSYRNQQNGKWQRNEQNYDSNSDRFGRNKAPRFQRPAMPQIDPENPFLFEISEYDLQLSAQTMQSQYELYSQLSADPDILVKLQALAAVAQQNLYKQQQNYNEFMEDKRQHDIERWLASMSEEDRRQYLERTKLAGARQPASSATSVSSSIYNDLDEDKNIVSVESASAIASNCEEAGSEHVGTSSSSTYVAPDNS